MNQKRFSTFISSSSCWFLLFILIGNLFSLTQASLHHVVSSVSFQSQESLNFNQNSKIAKKQNFEDEIGKTEERRLTVPTETSSALSLFYVATGGSSWTTKTNWMNGDPCSNSWFGVTCSGSNVVSLSLANNNLIEINAGIRQRNNDD